MLRIRLTRLAEQHLIEAWQYSKANWGTVQADSYLDAINRSLATLAEHPESGTDRGELREGYRAFRQFRTGMIAYAAAVLATALLAEPDGLHAFYGVLLALAPTAAAVWAMAGCGASAPAMNSSRRPSQRRASSRWA